MTDIAHKHKSQLDRIKNNIENSYDSFKENYDRYNEFRNFVFVTTMSDNEKTLLSQLKKPQVEFNILEAYISRLRGEFSKQEPSILVSAKAGKEVDGQLIDIIEGHVRYILQEANKAGLEYHCYTDTLSGGFSSMKVFTDYTGEMSFHQDIYIRRVFDPTLVGFDPMAMREDKADAEYCFEIFPKRREDLEREFPEADLEGAKSSAASPSVSKFQWSYDLNDDEVFLIADYYEKKKTKKRIIMLADGQVMTEAEYKKFLEEWELEGKIAQPPIPVGKPRTTEITKIIRYKLIGTQILDYEETDYRNLPLIFVDGNSILQKKNGTGVVRQMTRPYVYNAKGVQKMKNFTLQTLCNDIENMGPSKLIVAKDAIPPQYIDAYTNPQQAIVYIYNAFKNDDVNVPLPPPQPMPRPVIPPEIANAAVMSDQLASNILGSFDASMAQMTQEQMSGKAVQEVSTMSNAAAMPYVVSFMRGLQSAAQAVVDLIPLYYTTPRTIPVIDKDGKKSYVKINQEGGISMDYENDAIQVNIEAGVSFNIQQDKALQHINALMHASPKIAKFFSGDGMKYLFNNMSFRGVEHIEEDIEQFIKQEAQIEQQMMQAQMQQPKMEQMAMQVAQQQVQAEHQVGMAKVQVQAQDVEMKAAMKMAELEIENKKLQIELAKAIAKMHVDEQTLGIEQQRADDERVNTVIDAAIKQSEHTHGLAHKAFERSMTGLQSDRDHELAYKGLETKAEEAAEKRISKG
jgi:Phage P22-like portal protein